MANDNRLIGLIVLVAIVVGIFYFLPKLKGPECKVDTDCPEGQVCSMEGKCIPLDIVNERERDNFCPDNDYPKGAYDPDCPRYCPAYFEREGSVTLCCQNKEMTMTVDCETGVPINLFPEVTFGIPEQRPAQAWYDMVSGLQALVSFVPSGGDKSFVFHNLPATPSISVTTGPLAKQSTGYKIWLSSISVKSKITTNAEPQFTTAWANCKTGALKNCIGMDGAVVMGGGATLPSAWVTNSIDIESIAIDGYEMVINYCGIALPESLQIPQQCAVMKYDMDVDEAELSFEISAGIGY